MQDVRVADDRRRADHVVVSVIREVEAAADVRRLNGRHRGHRESQRYIQHTCSQPQNSNKLNTNRATLYIML